MVRRVARNRDVMLYSRAPVQMQTPFVGLPTGAVQKEGSR
jgi:hypothetical protein